MFHYHNSKQYNVLLNKYKYYSNKHKNCIFIVHYITMASFFRNILLKNINTIMKNLKNYLFFYICIFYPLLMTSRYKFKTR